jgi:hypothetical protein
MGLNFSSPLKQFLFYQFHQLVPVIFADGQGNIMQNYFFEVNGLHGIYSTQIRPVDANKKMGGQLFFNTFKSYISNVFFCRVWMII